MSEAKKEPDKIIRAGGKEFRLYREYDAQAGVYTLIYPEFAESPEYTAAGHPFTTAEREGCPHYKPPDGGPESDDCGGCTYFYREEAYAIIGVCLCGENRRAPEAGETETKDDLPKGENGHEKEK